MCLTFSDYIHSKYVYEYKNRKRERKGRTSLHVGDTGYIPLGDIFIKGTLVGEHSIHTNNIRCIPYLNLPILVHYCRSLCTALYPFIYDTT